MKTNGPAPPGLTREPREYQAGVPSFSSDPYRFHEMKELDAYTLNQMVATLGWNKVVSQLAPTPAKDYLHPQRRLPLSLLPVKPGDTVLEAGAGWASLAYPMAKTHPQAKVYAYDTNLEALFFLSLLKQAQSLENLAILRGDLINLPFEDGFFNHILLMGTPTSPPVPPRSRDHRSAPPRVLQEAFRVLANRGTLMAGVDSRFGRHYRNGGSGPPGPRPAPGGHSGPSSLIGSESSARERRTARWRSRPARPAARRSASPRTRRRRS